MLQTLTFSGDRIINAAASFFRYESGSAGGADESIRVRADGADLGLYFPGDAIELPGPCSMWEIKPTTSACAGVVRLGIGRVQSARLVGSVRVIDEASALVSSASVSPSLAVAPFAATQLVDPAQNVSGYIIRALHGWVQSGAGGAANMRIYAAQAAPGAFGPAGRQMILADLISSGGVFSQFAYPDLKKRIPAGWGIWICTAIAAVAAAQCNASVSGEMI